MNPLRAVAVALRRRHSSSTKCITGAGLIGALLFGFGTPAISSAATSHTTAPSTWTTFGGSSLRHSSQTSGTPAAPVHQAWTFQSTGGAIYGEPLIFDARIFVATEGDKVDALSATSGRLLWARSVGTPVPAGDLPCGDISPTVGVTSTMVIDPTTSELFVSATTLGRRSVHHELVALSLTTGKTLFRRDLDQPGWTAAAQLQRGALGLDDGRVIVGFGGNYGDCSTYHGYVMAVPETGTGATLVYQVPTQNQGAIWGAAGMSVDSAGNIYVATGNGSSRSTFDMGDAVIKLSSTLKLESWFAPTNWKMDNAEDLDLGSTAPMLLPGNRLFEIGKETTGYLLNDKRLGGLGKSVQSIQGCFALGSDAYAHGYVYLPCPSSGMMALKLSDGRLKTAWQSSTADGSPSVGGSLVWSLNGGNLVALALTTGRVVDTVAAPGTEHFATPAIGDGLVVVGGQSEVIAYR
jgi:outer membrane protein assembly factor BamB